MSCRKHGTLLVHIIGLTHPWGSPAAAVAEQRVAVVIGPAAGEVERYAAEQLCWYLDNRYGLKVSPATAWPPSAEMAFLLGSPATSRTAARSPPWPSTSTGR